MPYHEAVTEAESLLTSFGLQSKRDSLMTEMSGGEKRKLSVAIAVCGGSKFVVLDEPSAGEYYFRCTEKSISKY